MIHNQMRETFGDELFNIDAAFILQNVLDDNVFVNTLLFEYKKLLSDVNSYANDTRSQ